MNVVYKSIEYLLSRSSKIPIRQFAKAHNFYLYFSYQLFSLISLREFIEAKELSPQEMRKKFDSWIDDDKWGGLKRILNSYSIYKDKNEYNRFLQCFLLKGKKEVEFRDRAATMVCGDLKTSVLYFSKSSSGNYSENIKSVLENNSLPEFNRAELAYRILKFLSENKKEDSLTKNLPDKESLKKIIFTLFEAYLLKKDRFDREVIQFYHFNESEIDAEHKIKLNREAHKKLRKFLQCKKESFEGFLLFLIRSYAKPNDGRFTFYPYSEEIFESWDKLKTMVSDHQESDVRLTELKPFILRGIEELSSPDSTHYFELNEDDSKKVLKILDQINGTSS